ncbi:MAG: hypothetical protein CVV18_05850, partial [Gammaproteobacteria bacterium HGW-Gammaproteobacteria-8]
TVDLTQRIGHALDAALFPGNPRVRRWDGVAELKTSSVANPNTGWEELAQDGIELKFATGSYRVGDYWLIPARTATAAIEWPQDSGKPAFVAPAGVLRAFARLALLGFQADSWSPIADCRPLFPALTELTRLDYVGGDGQSVKPNPLNTPAVVALPSPLQVGVSNGQFPVANAQVRFTVDAGTLPNGTNTDVATTLANGVASIAWSLASDPTKPVQHARAELLVAGQPVTGRYLPVHFNAQLALASEVAYDPSGCADLLSAKAFSVQEAIDALCKRPQGGGGGCCVTVGEGGQFPSLDRALRTLLEKERLDICLCLLPGQHTLEDDLNVTGSRRHRVEIHGCGPTSRLLVRDQVFQFDTFGTLALQDFTLIRTGNLESLSFVDCDDLRLSRFDCVGSATPGNSLLRIGGSQRLVIEDSRVLADNNESKTLGLLLEQVGDLGAFKGAFRPTAIVDGHLPEFAAELSRLSAEEKKRMSGAIANMIRVSGTANAGLSQRELVALNAMRLGISNATAFALAVQLEQLGNAMLTNTPVFALALKDFGDVSLVNNTVRGRITLFGEGEDSPFPGRDLLGRLSGAINQTEVSLEPAGNLNLERNRLGGLRLSDMVLKDVVANARGSLPVCANLRVTDNQIDSELDHYAGVNCALNGNTLQTQDEVGMIVATQAKVIGNFMRNKHRLYAVAVAPESFGNGSLTITPV